MKIWIGVINHRHGQNVYAAKTEDKLIDQIYDYVKEWWDEACPSDKNIPKNLSKKEAIEQYFEHCDEEYLETMSEVDVL